MIQLVRGEDKNVIITLTEKTTIQDGFYYFEFIHETTKELIAFWLPFSANLTNFKYRNDEFFFDNNIFKSHSVGKYIYNVYESLVDNYGDIIGMVETGKMDFNTAEGFNFKQYSSATNYTQYVG
ncbi:hypothetical protein UFOVP208_39 [uncultured Caudovirales phage]|uniref:Uncharacterized protein n=1 Tax=uncultured Caudovirales phage TaxID=2100421 RepID=A0A6J7WRN5_9CAUD|nr:hypothetical protein UFOVP208_39 [uncultured Caudovirales phage]